MDGPTPTSTARRRLSYAPFLPAVLVCVLLAAPRDARSQALFEGWIGLYEPEQIDWLANEYRLDELCPSRDSAAFSACFDRIMAPMVRIIPLHVGPDPDASSLGEIITVAVPSGTLTAYYRPPDAASPQSIELDLYLADWGYGPYLHQTVSSRAGDWVALPPGPWPATAWIHPSNVEARLAYVRAGDILQTVYGQSWWVEAVESDRILVRDEGPADHWCEASDPPMVEPAASRWLTREELLDERGHLVVRPKYMKGC